VSEALFVPRSEDAPEGEGFLLSLATNFDTHLTSLYIFDALNLSQGPLARVHLSHRVPAGFHGFWRQNT
jgi:carotenoid cleavage dioxygenase